MRSGLPPRRIGPKPIFFQAIAAAGLISLVIGAPGVRAIRKRSIDWAPASALFESSTRLGRSSEWV